MKTDLNITKMLFKGEEIENAGLMCFSVGKKHFENVISLPKFSSKTNPKWPVVEVFLNFSRVIWT